MNTPADHYDVVIAGLGPTGLTLAHCLGQRGHQVLVLEREPAFYGNARAVYTDGECMRIFQSFGMADRLAADMLQDAPVQMVLPDGKVLFQLKNTHRPHGWPANNFFYQPLLETALADGLAKYPNVTVLRGRELTRFEQDAAGVDVFHVASDGSGYGRPAPQAGVRPGPVAGEARVRARYLVGADGGRSGVRAQLGISMTGRNFPNPWLVVDIKVKDPADGLRHLPYFNFVCDPACPTVSCVQPNGHHRFEFMLMPGQTREHMEHPDTVRHYLSKYVDVDKFEILRTLVYTFNALMAEKWRDGRVLLAGDAAHVHPPHGGQGLNTGVQDAVNLGWKLAQVVAGTLPDTLLDTYEAERHPVGAQVLRATEAQIALTTPDARHQSLRTIVADLLAMDEPRRHLAGIMSGLGIHYDLGEGHPLVGWRMPDVDLQVPDGPTRAFALLHAARPVLVDLGGPGRFDLAPWADRVDTVRATCDGPWDLPVLGAVPPPAAVLIRPDGHVAWAGDLTDAALPTALTTWFGPPSMAGER